MEFDAPEYLDTYALAEWMRLLDYMKTSGFCKSQHLVPFALYCQAVSQYRQAVEAINAEGFTTPGRQEATVKNPNFTVLKEAREAINKGSAQFGFSPGDWKALKLDDKQEEAKPDWANDL